MSSIKFVLGCSVAALCGVVLAAALSSQTVDVLSLPIPVVNLPGDNHSIIIKGRYAGGWHEWLLIEAHNSYDWKKDGYHPSYTRLVSKYKPLGRKLKNGDWEIMFTSEIAADLP
jgi:hypothetical protein